MKPYRIAKGKSIFRKRFIEFIYQDFVILQAPLIQS
jgi:hypothetical protein